MEVTNKPIPAHKMRQFHDILCATGGRYLRAPRRVGDIYRVDYIPGDCNAMNKAWQRCNTPIRETRVKWWRKAWRRITNNIRETAMKNDYHGF